MIHDPIGTCCFNGRTNGHTGKQDGNRQKKLELFTRILSAGSCRGSYRPCVGQFSLYDCILHSFAALNDKLDMNDMFTREVIELVEIEECDNGVAVVVVVMVVVGMKVGIPK